VRRSQHSRRHEQPDLSLIWRGSAAEILADTVLSDLTADRVGLMAEYELVLETSRHPALEAYYRQWQQSIEKILGDYARALGSSDPALDARIVLAMLRGLELEALARPSSMPTRSELTMIFCAYSGA